MYRLTSAISRITSFTRNPLMSLRARSAMLRPQPLIRARSWWSSMRYGALRLPQLPGTTRRRGRARPEQPEAVEIGGKPPPARKRRARVVASQREYAQIHLVDASGGRQIAHIGTPVGYQSTKIALDDSEQPVTLHFTQDDDGPEPVISVALVSGADKLTVDDRTLNRRSPPVPITTGTTLAVGTHTYTCELFTADDAPLDIGLAVQWMTSSGLQHDLNEDAIGIGWDEAGSMFVVADGVQGGYAGEQVSEFAVRYLLLVYKKNIPHGFSWARIFQRSFDTINDEVRRFAERSPDHAGTTLTAVVIRGWMAYVAHVGDSRLYLLRQNRLRQMTVDHVVASRAVTLPAAGEGAKTVKYPQLQRAIGKDKRVAPDIFSFTLQPGDRLLLCSDGVTDALTDEALAELMRATPRAILPRKLIEQANTQDLPDNASAVVIDVQSQTVADAWWEAEPEPRVYLADRVYAAPLEHPTGYETVYRQPARSGRFLPALLAVVVVVILVLVGLSGIRRPAGGEAGTNAGQTGDVLSQVEQETSATVGSEAALTPTAVVATLTALPSSTPAALTPTGTLPPTSTVRPSNK